MKATTKCAKALAFFVDLALEKAMKRKPGNSTVQETMGQEKWGPIETEEPSTLQRGLC